MSKKSQRSIRVDAGLGTPLLRPRVLRVTPLSEDERVARALAKLAREQRSQEEALAQAKLDSLEARAKKRAEELAEQVERLAEEARVAAEKAELPAKREFAEVAYRTKVEENRLLQEKLGEALNHIHRLPPFLRGRFR